MSVQLVLQLAALSNASLEPDEDELGDIKGTSIEGQIPYEDTRRNAAPPQALRPYSPALACTTAVSNSCARVNGHCVSVHYR